MNIRVEVLVHNGEAHWLYIEEEIPVSGIRYVPDNEEHGDEKK